MAPFSITAFTVARILFSIFCLMIPALGWAAPPLPPELDASSYILQDFRSSQVLAEREADKRVDPASLTKLMSAYVIFSMLREGKIKLEDKALVSEKAWKIGGSKMFLEPNTQVRVEDLLKGMIIQSGNDAAIALAEHISGSEDAFVAIMNQYAQRLRQTGTQYQNCTGMPGEQHYSTARDLAALAMQIIREFPDYYRWYSEKTFTYNGITQDNRNLLLALDKNVDGMKTGYTEAAGYCLVASAKQEDMRLVSVVMGTKSKKSRAEESQKLLGYGYRYYESKPIFRKLQVLATERIWLGAMSKVSLGLHEDLYVTYPRGEYEQLKPTLEIQPRILAPVTAGTALGKINILKDGKTISSGRIVALQDVPGAPFWRRWMDQVLMIFD